MQPPPQPQDYTNRHIGGFHVLDRDATQVRVIYYVRCDACGAEKRATTAKLSRVARGKSRMTCGCGVGHAA